MAALWSIEILPHLESNFLFFNVVNGNYIDISDAHKMWNRDNTVIFHTGYRIAGPQDLVIAELDPIIDNDEMARMLDTVIDIDNYQTTAHKQYMSEYNSMQKRRVEVLLISAKSGGYKLANIISSLAPPVIATKTNTVKTLDARIAALPPGKVLDVSKLLSNGTGAVAHKLAAKSTKHGYPDLPIVSSDYDHYLLAIRMMEGGEDAYQTELSYMREIFGIPHPSRKAPKPTESDLKPIKIVVPKNIETMGTFPRYTKKQREQMEADAALQKIIEESGEIPQDEEYEDEQEYEQEDEEYEDEQEYEQEDEQEDEQEYEQEYEEEVQEAVNEDEIVDEIVDEVQEVVEEIIRVNDNIDHEREILDELEEDNVDGTLDDTIEQVAEVIGDMESFKYQLEDELVEKVERQTSDPDIIEAVNSITSDMISQASSPKPIARSPSPKPIARSPSPKPIKPVIKVVTPSKVPIKVVTPSKVPIKIIPRAPTVSMPAIASRAPRTFVPNK